jgi:hypothetical protein
VVALQTAVKFAREEANNTEVIDQKVGAAFFGYLFSWPPSIPLWARRRYE